MEFKYDDYNSVETARIKKLYINSFLDMHHSEIISYSISK